MKNSSRSVLQRCHFCSQKKLCFCPPVDDFLLTSPKCHAQTIFGVGWRFTGSNGSPNQKGGKIWIFWKKIVVSAGAGIIQILFNFFLKKCKTVKFLKFFNLRNGNQLFIFLFLNSKKKWKVLKACAVFTWGRIFGQKFNSSYRIAARQAAAKKREKEEEEGDEKWWKRHPKKKKNEEKMYRKKIGNWQKKKRENRWLVLSFFFSF